LLHEQQKAKVDEGGEFRKYARLHVLLYTPKGVNITSLWYGSSCFFVVSFSVTNLFPWSARSGCFSSGIRDQIPESR
jgi:hypothetical protein